MTRAARCVYSVAVIAGLLLGGGIGYFMMFTVLHKSREMYRTIAPVQFAEYAYVQYSRADAEYGKKATEELVALLEEVQRLQPKDSDEWSRAFGNYQADLGFAYTRLSILADGANDKAASEGYMLRAVEYYSASGRKQHLTAAELKAMVKELDRRLAAARTPRSAS